MQNTCCKKQAIAQNVQKMQKKKKVNPDIKKISIKILKKNIRVEKTTRSQFTVSSSQLCFYFFLQFFDGPQGPPLFCFFCVCCFLLLYFHGLSKVINYLLLTERLLLLIGSTFLVSFFNSTGIFSRNILKNYFY